MTDAERALVRKWCDLARWPIIDENRVMVPDDARTSRHISWLLTGDGMCAVKREMAKRGKPIASLIDSKLAMAWYPITDINSAKFDESEPAAVLACAVEAMEKKG